MWQVRGELRHHDDSLTKVRGDEADREAPAHQRRAEGRDEGNTRAVHQESPHTFTVRRAQVTGVGEWVVRDGGAIRQTHKGCGVR